MVTQLISYTLDAPEPTQRARLVKQLRERATNPVLVLDTCQRLEVYGWQSPDLEELDVVDTACAQEALRRLARIAAGLESRIVGELEIMGQVREAYRQFSERYGKQDTRLDRLFQDAIALARKARRESKVDQTLTSLGALTARHIMSNVPEDATVAVIGSGSVAQSVSRYLGKRSKLPLRVTSRCPEHAMRLAMEVGGFHCGLDELAPMLDDAQVVVTATAAPHPLVYTHHLPVLKNQPKRLIIDLGEPPDCNTCVQARDDVEYIGLLAVEEMAQTNTAERVERGKVAAAIIEKAASVYRI